MWSFQSRSPLLLAPHHDGAPSLAPLVVEEVGALGNDTGPCTYLVAHALKRNRPRGGRRGGGRACRPSVQNVSAPITRDRHRYRHSWNSATTVPMAQISGQATGIPCTSTLCSGCIRCAATVVATRRCIDLPVLAFADLLRDSDAGSPDTVWLQRASGFEELHGRRSHSGPRFRSSPRPHEDEDGGPRGATRCRQIRETSRNAHFVHGSRRGALEL